jgi:hypothetical protein
MRSTAKPMTTASRRAVPAPRKASGRVMRTPARRMASV